MTEQNKPTSPTQQPTQTEQTEQLPLSSFYKVIDHITIFKSQKWWEAIVTIESYGRRTIAMYLWQNQNGKWKRKHKFQIRNPQEWEKVKNAIDKLTPLLSEEKPQLRNQSP